MTWTFPEIQSKTSVSESFFNKDATMQSATLSKKRLQCWCVLLNLKKTFRKYFFKAPLNNGFWSAICPNKFWVNWCLGAWNSLTNNSAVSQQNLYLSRKAIYRTFSGICISINVSILSRAQFFQVIFQHFLKLREQFKGVFTILPHILMDHFAK